LSGHNTFFRRRRQRPKIRQFTKISVANDPEFH
jgi:hypothetical protein